MTSDSAPLVVEQVNDLGGRIEARIRVSSPRYLRTTTFPHLVEGVLRDLPGLRRHRCECGSAHGIAAELADTEMPHLLEHVALELMVAGGAPRALRGETSWDFPRDGRGVFRVTLAYRDSESDFDDAAMADRAMLDGARMINELLADAPAA